ncbi:MAG: glycosyltransferase [Marmoricola sp.]|nr:glycosyltransferase [Marmoricola sp.]
MSPELPLSESSRADVPLRRLFGLDVAALTLAQVLERGQEAVVTRRRLMLGVINAAKVVNLRDDALLRDSLLECDLLLADGQSVVWASGVLGDPLPERTAGIDIFEGLLDLAAAHGHRVYLLGAAQDVLDRLTGVVAERWPGLVLAGSRNGYFEDSESAVVAAQVRAAKPDMLFLGMTSPKKEIFLGQHGDSLGVPVLHGVGGSFDVLAGVTRRAPLVWQRVGMEWAYRLVQEPRRLWRRYLRTNTAFVRMTVAERLHPAPAYARPEVVAPATPMVPALSAATEVPATPAALTGPIGLLAQQRRPDQVGLPTARSSAAGPTGPAAPAAPAQGALPLDGPSKPEGSLG